jgi:UMF1 family MFS transporter
MQMPSRSPNTTVAAWCLYDWANSPFTTLVVTFIYGTYFTQAIAPNEIQGTALWSRGVTVTALTVALLSPILGAAADRGGLRVRYLVWSTMVCVVATAVLTFVAPGTPNAVLLGLAFFVIANVAFEVGMVFYNSLLPTITPSDKIGRVSGYGWGLGYLGGLAALVVALVGFVQPEDPWFGLSRVGGFNIRATNLLVAAWFLVFSLPVFLIIKFLLARLVYNDGLVTIFAFGGIYAAGTFGFSFTEILIFGIVINIAAGLGALLFGFIDDWIGGKRTVLVSVFALGLATAIAAWSPNRMWLWIAGILIGIFAGPNQSASRSLMGRFIPPGRQAEFFGFFAFSGKFTAFLGPLLLGLFTEAFNSQRGGVAILLVFFVVGGVLLLTVKEREGIAAASSA